MRKNGMSEEQVAGARAFTERIAPISAVGAPSIGLLIVVPITALVLLGIARAAGAASLDFSGAGLISTYSIVPALLTALVGAALLLVIDAENLPLLQQMTVGPALLLGRDASPVLVAVATRFGVAEIWSVFITAAGVRVLGKRSAGSAMTIALLNWALGTVVAVLSGRARSASSPRSSSPRSTRRRCSRDGGSGSSGSRRAPTRRGRAARRPPWRPP
jgi:hypothetical protein